MMCDRGVKFESKLSDCLLRQYRRRGLQYAVYKYQKVELYET